MSEKNIDVDKNSLLKASETSDLTAHTLEDERYMRMALREAEKAFDEKEIPIGCVIVKDGVVIGKGHNQIEMLRDATAHAEILSIGTAASSLENWPGRLYFVCNSGALPDVRWRHSQ